jgi:hypothetical protein
LAIVVVIGGSWGSVVHCADSGCVRRASNILKDTVEGNVYVGVDANRDEENGNAPTVGEAVAQVKPIAPDPAPITADITVRFEY